MEPGDEHLSVKGENLCNKCPVRVYENSTPGCNVTPDAITTGHAYGEVVTCKRYDENIGISPNEAYEKSQRMIQDVIPTPGPVKETIKNLKATITMLEKAIKQLELLL